MYDADEDTACEPLISQGDVVGWYPHAAAAAGSRWTTTVQAGDPDD